LCLLAIIAQEDAASAQARTSDDGAISLELDDTGSHSKSLVGVGIDAGQITFPDIAENIVAGDHYLRVSLDNYPQGGYLSVEMTYTTLNPNNHPSCRVHLQATFSGTSPGGVLEITEGEGTEVAVCVTNITDQPLPMVIAQIRLPGGIEPRFEKLKELVKSGKVDYYEIFGGREVVLYWRGMEEKGVVEVTFDVVALVPGTYTGRASTAYLYYTAEEAFFVDSLKAEIKRAEKKPASGTEIESKPVQYLNPETVSETPINEAVSYDTNTLGDYDYGSSITPVSDDYGQGISDDLSMFGGGSNFGGLIGF